MNKDVEVSHFSLKQNRK